ncbi:MAG: HEAT repeat domain-containing protein [Sandaracinaceae bacterium]|nr:HEAT repeat domain-containing protein [Sandaracinaceae bacterium]
MKDIRVALASADAEERRRATAALARTDATDRGALLLAALGDEDWRVRKEAARVAADVAEPWGLIPDLVDALVQNDNVGLRNAALEVLERLGPRSASALLVGLPRVPEGARKFLVAALGFAGGAGVDRLAELSVDPDTNTAQAALEALARIGGARAEEVLRGHLASEDPVQRVAALEGLERLEAHVGLDELRPLLDDRLVRRLALRTLGYCEQPEAVELLLAALADDSASVAVEVAVALGRLLSRGGPPLRALQEAATHLDEPTRARLRGVGASGGVAARRAVAWVLTIARDPDVLASVAELAAEDRLPPAALDEIRRWGADAVAPLLAARAELAPRASATALEMASELVGDGADDATRAALRDAIREALVSDEPTLVLAAADGIGRHGEARDAEALIAVAARLDAELPARVGRALEALAERAPDAVGAALEGVTLDGPLGAGLVPAVAALGGGDATDRLQAALSADDARARKAAVIALPRLGGAVAAELAGFALADDDVDVQIAAVRVLAQLNEGAPEPLGLEQLRLALRATYEPVVAAAARALGAIGDPGAVVQLRELVSEGRRGVAVAAMEALRVMDDAALDDLLVEALGQSDAEIVKESLRAMARREGPRRAARIALALEHPAWDVRQLAATLLGDLGTEEARAALERRAEREADRLVRDAIERSLRRRVEAPS